MMSHLPRPSIVLRISIGFCVVIVVVAVSTLISMNYARETIDNVETLTKSATPIVLANSELELHLTRSNELFQQYLVTTTHAELQQLRNQINTTRQQMQARLESISTSLNQIKTVTTERQSIENLEATFSRINQLMNDAMGRHSRNQESITLFREKNEQIKALESEITPLFQSLVLSLGDDYAIAVAYEFYASFLKGIMIANSISLSETQEALTASEQRFKAWNGEHQDQFFSFINLAMNYPESQDFMQAAKKTTELLTSIVTGKEEQAGLVTLNRALIEGRLSYDQSLIQLRALQVTAKQDLDALNTFARQYSENTNSRVSTNLSSSLTAAGGALMLTILVAAVVLIVIVRSIRPSLKTLRAALGSLAEGDLTYSINHHSRDEMGELTQDVEEVRQALGTIMLELKDKALNMQTAAQHSQEMSEALKNQSIEQSEDTESISTSMHEMSATAREVADMADEGTQLATRAVIEIEQTVGEINANLQSLETLRDNIDQSVQSMESLTQQMKGVESVSSVIEGIAEQTNLLALNAAIEAARAGDQGRGFAVVADEVRNLASKTSHSTAEIRSTIEKLIQGYQTLSRTMTENQSSVSQSHQVSTHSAQAIAEFRHRISEINGLSQRISNAAGEQGSVAEDISHRLTRIADIAKDTRDNAVSGSETSDKLGQVAEDLEQLVERFQVAGA